MKIAIDISQVIYGTGVSVYTQNLVNALLKIDQENEYLLFGGSLRRLGELKNSFQGQFQKKIWPIPPTLANFIWNQLHLLPIEKLIGPINVFHSSDWTQPPTKAARVTTIHDLSFLRWPDSVHAKVLAAQKRRLAWVKKEVDLLIAVSEATRKETIELLGISPKKIVVIYEGPPKDAVGFQPLGLESIKKKFDIRKPYLFSYGSQAPRKNVKRLAKAFNRIKDKIDYQLVIVGEYQPKEELSQAVVLTGFLPRHQFLTLFSGAEALLFPSLYEGFGLIILEAFALGVPVITSNLSSLPEVAGQAAVLVDPYNLGSIADGIKKVIKDKKKLIAAGQKQVKKFSWEKVAKKTLGVYKQAVGEKAR